MYLMYKQKICQNNSGNLTEMNTLEIRDEHTFTVTSFHLLILPVVFIILPVKLAVENGNNLHLSFLFTPIQQTILYYADCLINFSVTCKSSSLSNVQGSLDMIGNSK